MENEWTSEWRAPPRKKKLPPLDAETLAAVRALQGGEIEASTRHLFAIFEPQLGAYFRRRGCQDDEAADLTQTVLIQMVERIGTLKEVEKFNYWLFSIAANRRRNFMRDRARDREAFEDFAGAVRKESESSAFWVRGSFEPSPEARLMVSESVERRRRVLRQRVAASKLTPAALKSLLSRLHGATYREIAGALEIPAGTVRSHVTRAAAALVRDLETIDPSTLAGDTSGDDTGDDFVARLSSELLTFKRETLEADPYYSRAGMLETASAEFEESEEAEKAEELALTLVAEEDRREKAARVARAADSPAAIAAVVRQDRMRGQRRRRPTWTIPQAGRRNGPPDLGPLPKDDLDLPLILLDEVAASNGAAGHFDGRLVLTAKLTCAHALLDRGRRFPAARRAKEAVELAILLLRNGLQAGFRDQVAEGRSLMQSCLGQD